MHYFQALPLCVTVASVLWAAVEMTWTGECFHGEIVAIRNSVSKLLKKLEVRKVKDQTERIKEVFFFK